MEKQLLIPYALVNGKVKSIEDIKDSERDSITCLNCGEKLILKAISSDYKVKHLSHSVNSKCPYKSKETQKKAQITESYEHKFAKLFLKDNLKYFRQKGIRIEKQNGELKLTSYRDLQIREVRIEEYLVPKYKPDLTIIAATGEKICLEIYKSNKKVVEDLEEKLKDIPVSIYEVDIRDIKDFTIKNIFDKMNLIYSDLKLTYDFMIKELHNEMIKHNNRVKQLIEECERVENARRIQVLANEKLKNELEAENRKNGEVDYIRKENENLNKLYNNMKKKYEKIKKEKDNIEDESKRRLKEITRLEKKMRGETKYGDLERMEWLIDMQKLASGKIDYDTNTGKFLDIDNKLKDKKNK